MPGFHGRSLLLGGSHSAIAALSPHWGAQPQEKTVRTILVKLVAALGLASALALATASSFAQSNPALDCYPRNGVSTC
jgi:hypothetical protein